MKILISLFAALLLSSCTGVRFNRSEVLERETSIKYLQNSIDNARDNDVDILAPTNFEKAEALLERAVKEAQIPKKDPSKSQALAEDGLTQLKKAQQVADDARGCMSEALEKRRQAITVQSHLLFQSEFEGLDKKFKQTSRAMEEGRSQAGIQENLSLASSYAALEVKALKADISENATKAYEAAEKLNALTLAPETMKKAKSELMIARKIIDLEKGDYDKAQEHAQQAFYLANKARYIAEIITGFQKEKRTSEQWILWYQEQLEQAHQELDRPLSFAQPNRDVIASFRDHIHNKIKSASALVDQQAKELSKQKDHLDHLKSKINKPKEPDIFADLSALFKKTEAEVLKRDKDIIIRSYGFEFDIGKAELLPSNFTLLHKIVTAIKKFPKANILVEGHTDSTGSDEINMRLSKERANNIRAYLVNVAEIDGALVQSAGFGKEKPLATNATKEGRAKNRRIEIVIKH